MIYTAEEFAAYVTGYGADVSTSTDGGRTAVTVHHAGVRARACFGADGRFREATVHPDGSIAYETLILTQVMDALGLPVPAMTCRHRDGTGWITQSA